jgi:universal stress protein A
MTEFKKILIVSRSTEHCVTVLRAGVSLARRFGAKLYLLHIIHDPFNLDGWNLPTPSFSDEYEKMATKARQDIEHLVQVEKAEGLVIEENIEYGLPADEIQKAVESNGIDLILMPAHTEGRFEHFLFGKTNDAIIRKLPATLMLVKC